MPPNALLDLPLYDMYWNDNGTELLVDGSMEAAGVAAWIASHVTPTKDTTTPHAGAQCLKLSYLDAVNGYVAQTPMTIGRTYHATGFGAGDGTSFPRVLDFGGPRLWDGTTSTDWQPFDIRYVTANVAIGYYGITLSAGHYARFDDLSLQEQFMYTANRGVLGGKVQVGDGRTVGTFPTMLNTTKTPRKGVNNIAFTYLTRTTPLTSGVYTVVALVQKMAAINQRYLLDCRDSGGTGWIATDAGGVLISSSGTIYVNDVPSATLNFGELSCVAVTGITLNCPGSTAILNAGAGVSSWQGNCFGFMIFPGTLTPRQLSDVRQRMLSEVFK